MDDVSAGSQGPNSAPTTQDAADSVGAVHGLPSSLYDGWELEERLRHIGRILGRSPSAKSVGKKNLNHRFDDVHVGPLGGHPRTTHRRKRRAGVALADIVVPFLSGAMLLAGLTTFVCGGVLMGWSWFSHRADLWNIGLPITLFGAIGLLVAFLLQLDRLGAVHRQTAEKLDRVHNQLHRLHAATTLLGNAPHSPGGAFYSHLADGAGPQLLLTDLKSQLDLLTIKLSQQNDAAE